MFSHDASQQDVFVEISQLVQSALDGYKVILSCLTSILCMFKRFKSISFACLIQFIPIDLHTVIAWVKLK